MNTSEIISKESVYIKDGNLNKVITEGQAEISNTQITMELECRGHAKIIDSTIQSIFVHQEWDAFGLIIRECQGIATEEKIFRTGWVFLKNTTIRGNIQFEVMGEVFFRGNSRVEGEIINGKINSK